MPVFFFHSFFPYCNFNWTWVVAVVVAAAGVGKRVLLFWLNLAFVSYAAFSLLSLGAKEFWVTKFKQLDLLTSWLVTYDLREQAVVIVVVVERTSPFALLVVVAKSKQIKR